MLLDDNTVLLQAAHALNDRYPHLAEALRDIVRRDAVSGIVVKQAVRAVILSDCKWAVKENRISEIVEG